MVKHIVMWSFQETLDDKQKKRSGSTDQRRAGTSDGNRPGG